MSYATVTSILTIVPDLAQTTSSAGYSTTVLTVGRHITRAESIINGKLSKRYSLPVTPTPPLLTTLSEDISAWMTFRSFYTQDNQNEWNHFEVMGEQAFQTLEMLRLGDINLVDTSGSIIAENSTEVAQSLVDSNTIDYQPVFDMDDPLEWKVDNDLDDDIAGKR